MRRNFLFRVLALGLALALPAGQAWANDLSNSTWSETDASNNSSPPNGWPAGMAPNQVEPTSRAMMGALKRTWNRENPTTSTTGSAGAYVLTLSIAPPSYVQGEFYCAKANFTAVGSDTLNVNALGAKGLYRKGASGPTVVLAGDIQSGEQFCASYDTSLAGGSGGFQVMSATAGVLNGALLKVNNLSDVANVATSRTNLGLGTAATQNTGTSGGTLPFLNGSNSWSGTQTFSTGATLSAALTYGGVTLSNSVTGTGPMVLGASPSITGTLTAAAELVNGQFHIEGGPGTGSLVIDKVSNAATRFRLFVGDGSGTTVADENYIANANTTMHIWGGAAGQTELGSFAGTVMTHNTNVVVSGSNTLGVGGSGGSAQIFAQLAAAPTISLLKTGIAEYILSINGSNQFTISQGTASTTGVKMDTSAIAWEPITDNVTALGTASFRWSSAAIAGTLTLSNATSGTLVTDGSGNVSAASATTLWTTLMNGGNYVISTSLGNPSASTQFTLNHGFGALPRSWGWGIRCTTSEYNWAIGDVITAFSVGSLNGGVTAFENTTQVGITTGTNVINVQNKTTGGGTNPITPANWQVVLWAYK